MSKLFIVVSVDWVFLSHRLPVALEAKKRGFDVTVVTTNSGRIDEIQMAGLKTIEINLNRSGKNPFKELKTIYSLWRIFKKNRPDVIHLVAIKPCIYGSMAAKLARIKNVVIAITGLGYNFTDNRKGFLQKFLLQFFRYSTKQVSHFIFQNQDDADFIVNLNGLQTTDYSLIKGCGVDLSVFSPQVAPISQKINFVLPARMLYDKGIIEFIEAAKSIQEQVLDRAIFTLVGGIDIDNPAGITEQELYKILVTDYIVWSGYSRDIISVLKNAHVVVLPSYREGLPKSLIEAAAVGKPIITTDAPGCKECVIDGVNGFIVPVKDRKLLADKMLYLINNKETHLAMGRASRELAEKEFDVNISVNQTLSIYNKLLEKCSKKIALI